MSFPLEAMAALAAFFFLGVGFGFLLRCESSIYRQADTEENPSGASSDQPRRLQETSP